MSVSEYMLSLEYSKQVYKRRDVVFALELFLSDNGSNSDNKPPNKKEKVLEFVVKQPHINDWVKEKNKELKEKGEWLGPR